MVRRQMNYDLQDSDLPTVAACRIIVVHEQNHFVQATRVTEAPGFPG